MSLLDEAMDNYVIMNKIRVPDGYGGTITEWTEGAQIKGAIDMPDSQLAQIADKLTERANCNFITKKNITLVVNDVVKRVKDGMYLRILQDSKDRKTPASAELNARVARAEILTALPDGE